MHIKYIVGTEKEMLQYHSFTNRWAEDSHEEGFSEVLREFLRRKNGYPKIEKSFSDPGSCLCESNFSMDFGDER